MLFSEFIPPAFGLAGVIKMEERQVKIFKNLLHDESGQDLIEYALVAALIALGAITAMKRSLLWFQSSCYAAFSNT